MPFRFIRIAGAALMAMGLVASSHAADDWMPLAMISSSLGTNEGRICIGASRTDIGCPVYAPLVGTDGSISASRFVGDGSELTGVVASSADRIISGTTSLVVVSNTRYISLPRMGATLAGLTRRVVW